MQLRNGKLLVWAVSWWSSGHLQRKLCSWANCTWLSALKILNKILIYPSTSIPTIAWQISICLLCFLDRIHAMNPDLTNLYYRERDIETKTNIDIERYALSSPEKNLPPVQSRRIHRSQDLGKSPTCLAGWQGDKTWELRHQFWWLRVSVWHFAY